jgi:Ferritin-like domain
MAVQRRSGGDGTDHRGADRARLAARDGGVGARGPGRGVVERALRVAADGGAADPPDVGISRGRALDAALLTAGGLAVAGVVLGRTPDTAGSRPSAKQDAEILNFALLIEYVQSSFYSEALRRAKLEGELRQFARVVSGHERAHLAFIKKALGSAARRPPKLDFGDDTAGADRFARAAEKLEDLGVAAYNAHAPSLTVGALTAAARIVSVEARHAAWIRDIRGDVPAPFASEPQLSPKRIAATLEGSGYIR